MSSYEGVDFYRVDDLLSDEEKAIREAVRAWVEDRVLPIIERHYQEGTFPTDLAREMGEMGFLGANLSGYGCPGLNNVCYGLICQELERGDSAIRSFASVQGSLVMFPIHAYGSEEQKQRWLPRLARGEAIGCFGLTEPDFGSNPSGMITKAEDRGDHYLLNGAKMWITNGTLADVAVVWAKLDGVVHGFLVEEGMEGFSAPEMTGKHSLRASVTSELVFSDVRLPKENLLPGIRGLRGPLSCLNNARYGIAWGALGAATGCFHSATEYAKSRIQFDGPIARFQLVQDKLAWMLREITKGQLLAWRLGRMKDEGTLQHEQVSLAKMNNVDIALRIARTARDIHGANGILGEYPIMRHMANLESVYTYEGTHDIHNLVLGRWITGIPAFT
ncbi:MAG TPA: acyl-CoA dehydrogenase [Deltaproteobacteria bacterium]|nr:acyl-CoA dehydrogenase [Deltaproteobacteria bacterium]